MTELGATAGSQGGERPPPLAFATPLMARLDRLAAFSDDPACLTRLYLSPAHVAAAHQVGAWMQAAGMRWRIDAIGNVVGRCDGADAGRPALMLGSHIDTVRNAGRYDGALGVLAAIAAVAELRARGERLRAPVEVIAFGDEEGVRFPTTLLGSRAVAGTAEPRDCAACDADGISVRDALGAIGGDADAIASCGRRVGDVAAYLELHIEQGPVLEAEGKPLGVVTAISGATRLKIEVVGVAGHAGTTPMRLRRDALAAAAEMVLAVEQEAGAADGLVATVGVIDVRPKAVNVIAGYAGFTLDVRSPDDSVRAAGVARMRAACERIATRRGVAVDFDIFHDAGAVACDGRLMAVCEAAIRTLGEEPRLLPSGAGHDAMAIAALCPVAMIFVRCRCGISHNPRESIAQEDADLGVRVLIEALRHLDALDGK